MAEPSKFEQALAEKRARDAAKVVAPPVVEPESPYSNLGTEDLDEPGYRKTQDDQTVDAIVDQLDVESAFRAFIPKEWRSSREGGQETMMRCPLPTHPDNTPSASWKVEKDLWRCHKCEVGGDKLDIAAIGLGLDLKTYKQGANFPKMRRAMAEKLGWAPIHRNVKGDQIYTQIAPEAPALPATAGPPPANAATLTLDPRITLAPVATITQIASAPSYDEPLSTERGEQVDEDADVKYPSMGDWREKLATNDETNFLYEYMLATTDLPYPDEYNFWNGLVAIGSLLGRNVWLGGNPHVFPNLYVCTVGPTGGGKSQSGRPLSKLLRNHLAYEPTNPDSTGMKLLSTPNSEVWLINEFRKEIDNPLNPKAPPEIYPVKGLVTFSELSALMSRTKGEKGGKFEAVTMELFDNTDVVSTGSMGGGNVEAPEPFCMMLTTTQLKSVKTHMSMTDAGSGFLNRWCFAMGPTVERGFFSDVTDKDMIVAGQHFDKIKAFYSLNGGQLGFTPDGYALAAKLWVEKGAPVKKSDGTELLKRIDLLLKKLMIIFAANRHLKMIDAELVNQVYSFFDYIVDTYRMIGARIGITIQGDMENKVIAALINWQEKHTELPTATRISKNLSASIDMKSLRQILADLAALNAIEVIAPIKPQKGERYRYVG